MSDKPLWRNMYDRMADEVGPLMTDVTGSDRFAEVVEVAEAVRSRAATELQRSSRRVLHAWNLPAGTDIAMLRREIGALDREVRALARQVEALQQRLDAAQERPTKPATTQARRRAS
jgi:predicted RNase H-like nuclease (RuvC/YqgF family)